MPEGIQIKSMKVLIVVLIEYKIGYMGHSYLSIIQIILVGSTEVFPCQLAVPIRLGHVSEKKS